jgi:acyl-CoA thioester hydrolase
VLLCRLTDPAWFEAGAVQGVDALTDAKDHVNKNHGNKDRENKPHGRRPAPRPEDFPHRAVQTIRFSDLDRQDHVNNAVFVTFFEAGRVVILYNEEYGLRGPGASFVLAHLSIDYLGEIRWPGEVEIGTAIAAVGNSSLRVHQALFVNGVCVATAENTLVRVDKETHRPLPFTPEHAARIRASAPAAPGPC